MVKKVAQRAIAAGLAGMMSFGAVAPAAMAIDGTTWTTLPWWSLTPTSDDDGLVFWKRIKGDTRYDTMKKILEAAYVSDTDGGNRWINAAEAVVASGDNWPDALAANGLAGTLNNGKGAPVILTKKGALSSQAKELLEKMQVQHVYIMGGTAAVSQEVEDKIADLRIATTRVAGKDRQETSMKAFNLISGNWYKNYGTHSVIIATGANYADALSIAPFAYQTGTPIVLTQSDGTLTDAQVDAIKANDEIYNIIIVGGEKAVNPQVFGLVGTYNKRYGFNYTGVRIDGADRYETSANIADWEVNYAKKAYNHITGKTQGSVNTQGNVTVIDVTNIGDCYFDWDFTFVATGENFPDALAGAQLAGGSYENARGNGWIAHTNKQGNKEAYISGSPILLTKDGDRTAEMVIARSLAWNTDKYYKKESAKFANWFDLNKATGMKIQDFVEDYLALGFFSTSPMASGMNALNGISNWAGLVLGNNLVVKDAAGNEIGMVFGTYVIDRAGQYQGTLDSTTPGDATLTYGSLTQKVKVVSNQMRVVYNKTKGEIVGYVLDYDKAVSNTVQFFGQTKGYLTGEETALEYTPYGGSKSSDTFQLVSALNSDYIYGANGSIIGVRTLKSVLTNQGTGSIDDTENTVTINGKTYVLDLAYPKTLDIQNAKADIYIYDGINKAESNFHGIIFGGTAAVSKDKAKDLDKAVKDSILTDVTGWEWEIGENYNNILNSSLMGEVFYGYRSGTGVTNDGDLLTEYYAPATAAYTKLGYLTTTSPSTTTPTFAGLSGYYLTDNAADSGIVGVAYSMPFYHYSYVVDPVTGITDWAYDGTITAYFVVNGNTGVMTMLPLFM